MPVRRLVSAKELPVRNLATVLASTARDCIWNAYRPDMAERALAYDAPSSCIRVDLCGGHAVSVCFKGGLI